MQAGHSCILKCNDDDCCEPVAVGGDVHLEEQYDPNNGQNWENVLTPRFVHPAPDFFPIPKETPDIVAGEIRRAFSLAWCDPAASVNRIRASVELLLDHLRIPRSRKKKTGKMEKLSLHRRIQVYKKKQPDIGEAFEAIKWVGNEGSHPGELEREDLFDDLDILRHVLEELFEKKKERISKMVREINRKRGPRSRRTRRARKNGAD